MDKTLILDILNENLPKYQIHEINFFQQDGFDILQIVLNDNQIDINDLSQISEQISDCLDVNLDDSQFDNYYLEVCSKGLEYEIKDLNQLDSMINQYFYLETREDEFLGNLKETNATSIKIEYLVKGRKKTAIIDKDAIVFIRTAVKV